MTDGARGARRFAGKGLAWSAVLGVLSALTPAFAAPPYKYYVLTPEPLASDLSVVSLEPGNTITAGTVQRFLGAYETATIPAAELAPGTIVSGSALYSVGSNANAADLLAPDFFAGTSFVIPHITGSHKYYVQATTITANLTIHLGGTPDTLQINPGIAYEIDAGSDNGIAGRITSDEPIVVAHVAYVSGTPRDAYPVPPAAAEVLGIRSQNVVIGAAADGTSVTVYTSDAATDTYALDAGDKVTVTVGGNGAQGAGASVRIVANQPVAAVQYNDGDGDDASAFWPSNAFTRKHGIPVNTQYVAVACLQSATVTLFKGSVTPETQSCTPSGSNPGKAYFGSATSGANLTAGWSLHATAPVYVMHEAATPEDEHNLSGAQSAAGPSAPSLSSVSSPTTSNPLSVSGTAGASATVRLYVNGRLQQTTTASGGGAFSFNAELFDGNNVVHAVEVASGNESDPSNILEVTYNNTIARTQSGTISNSQVWTPGSPATPYVISGDLTVAPGGKLVLQAGTTLRFANGALLLVNGLLKIAGTSTSLVTLTSNAASPTKGIWDGVTFGPNSIGSEINYAWIEWGTTSVAFSGMPGVIRNSTIRNFSANGIYVNDSGAHVALIQNNVINNLNDTGDCIDAINASPLIQGNTITNCNLGIHIRVNSSPTVNANNVITGNEKGIYIDGTGTHNPAPVINVNQITSNDQFGLQATGFINAGRIVDAKSNWWGSANTTSIDAAIDDLSNATASAARPTVDWSYYLDGPGGDPTPGNYLLGHLTATTTTLTAGTTYQVLGALFVDAGKTLVVQSGTVLRFHGVSVLNVDGTLTVQGVSGTPAVLTSGRTTPARADWEGVNLRAGSSGHLIEHARFEWASTPVEFMGVSGTIRNTTFNTFLNNALLITSAGSSATLVENNVIDNGNNTGDCIEALNSSPTIRSNTLTNCDIGINIHQSSSPTVNNQNIIVSNNVGIYVDGDNAHNPNPVINGNQIFGNVTRDLSNVEFTTTGSTRVINAQGNWWGTASIELIPPKIWDLADDYASTRLPSADWSNFLSSPNGSPVAGNYLFGALSAASTTLTTGNTYLVIGALSVPAGKSLTLQAGSTVRFYTLAPLLVNGTLTVSGTSSSPVVLTSGKQVPAKGDWEGIRVQAAGSLIEYANISYANNAVYVDNVIATVRHNTITQFAYTPGTGVYVNGAGASGTLVHANYIQNDSNGGRCIVTNGASPTITNNTLLDCDRAIYLFAANTSTITGNIIRSHDYGIYIHGDGGNPQPVITGNQIYDNLTQNLFTEVFGASALNVRINATGNWWGTTDLTAINPTITDWSNDPTINTRPVVDYANFLSGPSGPPVAGNHITGPFAATNTTLVAGATYEVLGNLLVQSGKTLTIPAGTKLKFYHPNIALTVDGTLTIQGVSGTPAELTSGRTSPLRGDWTGVVIRAGTGSLIEYAKIDYAETGVYLSNVAATVRNNEISHFAYTPGRGIWIRGAGASAAQITSNVLTGDDWGGRCILVETSSPTVSNNTTQNCDRGIYVFGASSPSITGNIMGGNDWGFYVDGNGLTPQPVVTGNQFFANREQNYVAANFAAGAQLIKLNATGNWWGTTNPQTIAAEISDLTDDYTATTLPTVDFSGFLDGPGGSAVAGNFLVGALSPASTTLTTGTVYDVIGALVVPPGKTLVIQSGAHLRFHPGTSLIVEGTLQINGTATARARLAPNAFTGPGNWNGILVRASATGVVIDYANIEYAVRGVDVTTSPVIIRNSIIRNSSAQNIRMNGVGTAAQITNNYIDNYSKIGDGIFLTASSPSITGNRIYRTNRAIVMTGASNPSVTGNILTGNNIGIFLGGAGSNSATAVPRPTITGNDIFGNTSAQIEVNNYGPSNPAVITATNNWWGTPTPVAGTHIKFTQSSPTSTLNFSSPASAPLNGAVAADVTMSEVDFSPNADTIKDTTTVQGTLSQSSSYTVNVYSLTGTLVRTLTGSGTAIAAVWDGQNGSGVVQPDGGYDFEVTVAGSPDPLVIAFRRATLDNSPPTLLVTSPAASTIIQGGASIPVSGTASDPRMVNYTLEFGAGTTPSTWTTIQTQTASVTSGTLGTWTYGSVSGGSALAAGPYVLRLRSSDTAGNSATLNVPITLDTISVSGVTQNLELIRPLLSEQLQIGFTLSAPATAYLRIYPEQGGAMVKEVSQVFGTSGAKTLSWDGRNTAGNYVPDEAYSYQLFIESAGRTTIYDPPDSTAEGSGTGTIDSTYNASRNDYWKMNYTLSAPKGRIRMQVSGCGVTGTHMVYNWVPFMPGTFLTIWDGRDQNGNIVSGTCDVYFDAPDRLKPASVIVKGIRPVIVGTGASPNIEVKSNPYRATHSFDQVSRFTYRLDQDSHVTVKLLPPGISDPGSPQAIVLVNNVLQNALSGGSPADHTVEWTGYDPGDTNDILVSSEGTYSFVIQATSATTGAAATYRGSLQLYR